LAACGGEVTGPAASLIFRVEFLSPTDIVPGQRAVARVEVMNPHQVSVVFRCPPAVALMRDEDHLGQSAWVCPLRDVSIPPRGMLVDTVSWSGQGVESDASGLPVLTDLPSGRYGVRPVLLHRGEVVARGDPRELTVRPWTRIRLVNATAGPLDLAVAERVVARAVNAGAVSAPVVVEGGAQVVEARVAAGDSAVARLAIGFDEGVPRLLATRDAGGATELWEVPDGGPVSAPQQTYLRVVHLAPSASVVELRVYAAGAAGPQLVAPFPYGAISPYLSGTIEPWRVLVTAGGGDTLLATAPLPVPGGTSQTVFLVDSPTGRIWATLVEGFGVQ
jgi:hypothetical protein